MTFDISCRRLQCEAVCLQSFVTADAAVNPHPYQYFFLFLRAWRRFHLKYLSRCFSCNSLCLIICSHKHINIQCLFTLSDVPILFRRSGIPIHGCQLWQVYLSEWTRRLMLRQMDLNIWTTSSSSTMAATSWFEEFPRKRAWHQTSSSARGCLSQIPADTTRWKWRRWKQVK